MPDGFEREGRVSWILTVGVVVAWLATLVYSLQDVDGLIGLGAFAVLLALFSWYLEHRARMGDRTRVWRQPLPGILKALLVGVTLVLLSSVGTVGGAVAYLSPILLPLHFLASRSSRVTAEVLLWAVLAASTGLEAMWIATFVAVGETLPWIWLLPALAAIVTGTLILAASCIPRQAPGDALDGPRWVAGAQSERCSDRVD